MRGLLTGVPPRATAALDEITSFVGDGRTQMLFATLLWAAAAGNGHLVHVCVRGSDP
jgi:hypothetical protein